MTCHNPQRSTLPVSACIKTHTHKNVLYNITHHTIPCKSNLPFSLPVVHLRPTRPETFLCCLVDIKEAPCGDISIQETCWHSYQTSKSLVSFWKGLMREMEMLKGVLAPNITKGWEDMNTLWLKDWERRQHDKEKKERKKVKPWNAYSREKEREREALGSISA